MAKRGGPTTRLAQGLVLCAIVLGVVPLLQFLLAQGSLGFSDHGIGPVVVFTLKQAVLSTLLSVTMGIGIARALARQTFAGKMLFLRLLALPMAMPAIVAVLGLVSLFGNAGLFPGFIPLYGFWGIVLAHVFFNLPMCVRLFYQALGNAPEEGFKLAAQLNLGERAIFHHVEWPALRPVIARGAALVFLLCAASFVIALSFGGASATTLEVAIYQSLRLDFDIPRALQLSLVQVALSLSLIGLVAHMFDADALTFSLRQKTRFRSRPRTCSTVIDWCLIALAGILVLPVVAAVLATGLGALHFSPLTLQALGTSVALGFTSAALALLLALPLARASDNASHLISLAAMILPPAVMATGWFILLRGLPDSAVLSALLIVLLNCLVALPYAAATMTSGFLKITPAHEKLAEQLGLSGLARWRIVNFPLLRPQLAQAFLMGMVTSLGDLTAIMLFGTHGIITLPSLQQAEMGHYRGHEAAGTAALLLLLCGTLTFAAQRWGERHDPA
jgi:thiamine transport system permease protein